MLTPGRADQSRMGLRSALRPFFDACDADGNGSIDETELRKALDVMGMGAKVHAAVTESDSARSSEHDEPGTPLERRPSEQIPSGLSGLLAANGNIFSALFNRHADAEELQLSFAEFSFVIEEALAECGVEARAKWKKLAGLRKFAFLARPSRAGK